MTLSGLKENKEKAEKEVSMQKFFIKVGKTVIDVAAWLVVIIIIAAILICGVKGCFKFEDGSFIWLWLLFFIIFIVFVMSFFFVYLLININDNLEILKSKLTDEDDEEDADDEEEETAEETHNTNE